MAKTGYLDHGLEALIKALRGPPTARVGILAGTKSRGQAVSEALQRNAGKTEVARIRKQMGSNGLPTNAEIGAAHEYGSMKRKLKMRSWLRMPLSTHLREKIESNPKLMKATFAQAARDGTLFQLLKLVGTLGEATCKEAFTNDGWGTWPKLDPHYAASKTVKNILVETTQLRESITSKVEK